MASKQKRKRPGSIKSTTEESETGEPNSEQLKSPYFCGDTGNDIIPAKINKASSAETFNSDNLRQGPVKVNASTRLTAEFYKKPCVDLAKALLGQTLVHILDSGERLTGMIVETEAYCGVEDKAAHSYQGKRTARTEAMFMKPGTAYVYNIYGMYCCMNISSEGEGCAVLLRAIEPLEGLDKMREMRSLGKKSDAKPQKEHTLGNGPSKLCMALNIKKDNINQQDLTVSKEIWVEKGDNPEQCNIVTSKRINISYGEDWVDKPLRFYILDNKSVSVRDKEAEKITRQEQS